MTSKNTALLDMPIAELVKEAYGKAEELKLSFPEISALLRAAAGRIDVFNALLVLSSSVNVQRYSPDYAMHMNHEMAYMRPTDNGTFVSLADYVVLMKEHNEWERKAISNFQECAKMDEQVRALVAENAALKSGIGFFSYGTDSGYEEHATADDAIKAADSDIDYYRGDACDGWSDETDRTVWGVVIQRASMIGLHTETDDSGNKREICDYALLPVVETPATDAILREVGARAVKGFAAKCTDKAHQCRLISVSENWKLAGEHAEDYAAKILAGEVQP